MNLDQVSTIEESVKNTGVNGTFLLQPFSLPGPDGTWTLDCVSTSRVKSTGAFYYSEQTTKERIVLHFTVGHLQGDLRSLTNEGGTRGHVSVSFVVARDGTIYYIFNPIYWSNHLGKGAVGGNAEQSKKCIGIEISNYGPLTLNGNNLETAYSTPDRPDVYCTLDDTDAYYKLDQPFRGYTYYATFTKEQMDSIIKLLRYLTIKFDIPREFLDEDSRYDTINDVVDFQGIVSHINYRTDKYDIGTAFEWDTLIKGVQAEVYDNLDALSASSRGVDTTAGATASIDKLPDFKNPRPRGSAQYNPDLYPNDGPEAGTLNDMSA
jgi:N-acetyl-anhydromuramyl-L-alanine amidase AmpD